MSLSEEIQKYRKRQVGAHRGVPSNVAEKWDSRILKRNFHILGEKGAEAYLSMFGRGIGEKKVVDFAIKAEIEECQDMADGFWKKAYSIQSSESAAAKRINKKRRRLMFLEEQKARFGFGFTPSHILLEIEDLRRELEAYDADSTT